MPDGCHILTDTLNDKLFTASICIDKRDINIKASHIAYPYLTRMIREKQLYFSKVIPNQVA
jgi:hypothetical protein